MSIGSDIGIPHDPDLQKPAPQDLIEVRAPLDMMPTGTFSSSNVHSGMYDYGNAKLFMRYLRDGPDAIYRYIGVPPSTWDSLKQASSKGSYINANVAYSFTYEKLTKSNFPSRGRGLENDLARRFVTDP